MSNKQNEFDTIIIGSGAGGLASAICLSRAGQKVLVLEQHDVPGGWCHSFYLNGHRFTPGVHYIGLVEEGESTNELYTGLGIANDLVFYKMNPKAYEHCWVGEERFDFPANYNDLEKALIARFPKEEKGIKRYLKTVKDVSTELQKIPKMSGFWDHLTIPFQTKHLGKYGLFSLKRVIDWHVKDPLLKQILNIQCGDHGLPPAKASFPLHCAVMDHYFNGGYYPMGGGGALVKAMTKVIKGYSGEIRTSQSVSKILLEDGKKKKKAVGIELSSGEKIYAQRVISNADPSKTYLDMVGRENISTKLSKRLDKTTYSCSSIMLFLVVDMDVRAAGLDSGNIWLMPDEDTDQLFGRMMQKDISQGEVFEGFFVSCTTLKDPASFDGKNHSLEVITFINNESFEGYEGEFGERSEKYSQFKEDLTEKMLSSLEKVLPDVRQHIVQKDLGTPKTNEYYINSTNGSVYGTEKTFMQTGPFSYSDTSEVEDLYMCGASIISHGVAGAGHSGVATAAKILKCKPQELLKKDDSQKIRVYEAEDDSEYPEWMLKRMKSKRDRLKSKV